MLTTDEIIARLQKNRNEAKNWGQCGMDAARQGLWNEAQKCFRQAMLCSERARDCVEALCKLESY